MYFINFLHGVLFCGFTGKIDLLENGCSCTRKVAVNIWICRNNLIFVSPEDDDVLENYNTIWDKVSADIKKEFDSELVYNKNYLKTKIKSHGYEVTDFYSKKIPK